MNTTTISHHRSRRRGRIGRPAVLFVTAIAVAAGCGSEQSSLDANRIGAVEAARGSDRHLELQAREIADNSLQARVRAASGSDRHLELLAKEAADRNTEARVRAAAGSDRHLELLAQEIAGRSND